jgi:hypothetical protein
MGNFEETVQTTSLFSFSILCTDLTIEKSCFLRNMITFQYAKSLCKLALNFMILLEA